MSNPFLTLLGKPKEEPYDTWTGAFSCQEFKCYNVSHEGRYYKKESTLRWECEDGHKSEAVIEDD